MKLPPMHLRRWFLWSLLYAATTFAWIVVFEHGYRQPHFSEGAAREFTRLRTTVHHWIATLRHSR